MTRIIDYFEYEHLPNDLAKVSRPFKDLADRIEGIINESPVNPAVDQDELLVSLRKLLEAKDAAVRAHVDRGR